MTNPALLRPPDWTHEARCVDMTTRDWDPWSPDEDTPEESVAYQHHLARSLCAQCPVRMECLMDALADLPIRDSHAVRGGLTPSEQVELARELGMKWRREAQHGTRSRYVAGCRCEDCRAAHRIYEHERRLWAKKRRITRVDVYCHLTRPVGRGKRAAGPGQLVLFTDGLPATTYEGTTAA